MERLVVALTTGIEQGARSDWGEEAGVRTWHVLLERLSGKRRRRCRPAGAMIVGLAKVVRRPPKPPPLKT